MSSNKSIISQLGDKLPVISEYLNNEASNVSINHRLYTYYSNLALNRFRWEGLPDGLTSTIIEENLFFHGMACFLEDSEYGLICLPAQSKGWNIYNKPNLLHVHGYNYSKDVKLNDNLDKSEGVLILENDMRYSPVLHLMYYIELHDMIEKTTKMNLIQQRYPVILPKTSTTELSMKNLENKLFNEYFPVQLVDKKMEKALGGSMEVKALNTGVPFLLNDLTEFKRSMESELYTYLGINNVNFEKKERLITSEAEGNNKAIDLSLDIGYKNRQLACDMINKKYNLNVTVVKVSDLLDDKEEEEEEEVEVDE